MKQPKDFDICIGTGDVPSPLDDYNDSEYIKPIRYSKEDKEKRIKGLVQDSTGRWYDPNDYIDCIYADW